MKLTAKWMIWFIGIGLYVMALGGVFYYNLFKWTFDEKLKLDIIDTVKIYGQNLRDGLLKNPRVITFDEYGIMESLSKDERITSVIYLNKSGSIRWHREARFINVSWGEFTKTMPTLTDAIGQAVQGKTAKVRPVSKQPFYEIAIPLTVNGEIVGIIDLLVSRASSDLLISSAMKKYVFGALGVLFLLGLPFYFFFHHYVVSPLEILSEAIDSISFKTFEIRFPPKNDEIGVVAGSVSNLLIKLKTELENVSKKDKRYREAEEKWWRSVLMTTIPLNQYVIVVDENNNVLYANFELAQGMDAKNIHLLDVVDSQQQNLLRIVGQAFDSPGSVVEGETVFKGENLSVKVLHIGDSSEVSRTLILFYPKQAY